MEQTLLELAYKAADDKRGEDIVVLDMKGVSSLRTTSLSATGTLINRYRPLPGN